MMRKYPFACSLIGASVASGIMWSAILIYPTYSGAVALGLGIACGLALLIIRIRRAFTYASHDLADFVRGKGKKESLQMERLKAVRAAIAEAKARKEAASIGLKQPNQSSTVRYLNERLNALICEQLQLEGAIGKKGAA